MQVDGNGLTDFQTGQRLQMIKPEDVEYQEELGQGNGGIVKKAIHKQTGTLLAIKIINVYDKQKRHQLYNELKSLTNFVCPNLLRCYGAFFESGSVRLVLEYMDCGSMETIISVLNQLAKLEEDNKKAQGDNNFQKPIPLMPEYVISRIVC